jgi:hypothetical protein
VERAGPRQLAAAELAMRSRVVLRLRHFDDRERRFDRRGEPSTTWNLLERGTVLEPPGTYL